MFCGKCGNQIFENETVCPTCGNIIVTNQEPTIQEEQIIQNEPIIQEEFIEDSSEQVNIPSFAKKDSLKMRISIIVVLSVIFAIMFGVIFFTNTDSFKINSASDLVVQGKYSEALNKISNVYTPQAETIKKFIKLENLKDNFVNSIDKQNLVSYDSECNENYSKFKSAVETFEEENEIYLLTDDLKANYNRYKSALSFTSEYGADLFNIFYESQQVMLNKVFRNRTSKENDITFTLYDMQERVDSSYDALYELETMRDNEEFKYINITDSEIISYCYTFNSGDSENYIDFGSSVFRNSLDTLINACNSEANYEDTYISDELEKWNADDKLYLVEPNPDYVSIIGVGFADITSADDIHTNSEKLLNTLRIGIAYQLITGETY